MFIIMMIIVMVMMIVIMMGYVSTIMDVMPLNIICHYNYRVL